MAIFWRLLLGYCSILALGVAFSAYAVLQWGKMSGTAESALRGDQLLLGYEEKLTDAMLSQVRYGEKFVLTRSPAQYEQFRQFKKDFVGYLGEVEKRADGPELKSLVLRIQEFHHRYHYLFDEEARYLSAGSPYAESRFRQEKQKAVQGALAELEKLRNHAQRNLHRKLEALETAAANARTLAAVVAALLWSLGLGLAIVMARGITRPIAELKRRALEIALGVGGAERKRFTAREIEELACVLDRLRERLADGAAANAAFAERVTDGLMTVAQAIRARAASLAGELAAIATHEQRRQLQIIVEESDYALGFLAELRSERAEAGRELAAAAAPPAPTRRRPESWKSVRRNAAALVARLSERAARLTRASKEALSHDTLEDG